jgi:malonyl-CoA O-methyltransferase
MKFMETVWLEETAFCLRDMTKSTTHPKLPIDAKHVRMQFARRGDLNEAQFIYGEVASRMLDRLKLIRLQPQQILDAGCGAGHTLMSLQARYPNAQFTGLDFNPRALAIAKERFKPSWLDRASQLMGKPLRFNWLDRDLAETGLQSESIDLIWSNLALHWHCAPHDVLHEWSRILKIDGLAFFSCFGPGTLLELRQAINQAGLQTQTPGFVDMHDFGDLLIENGFGDPVMDQETLTLTYKTAERLLSDVQALGGNPSTARRQGLAGRKWRGRLLDALDAQRGPDGLIRLSIEVAYGHAWRLGQRKLGTGETRISLNAIGRKSNEKP